MQEACASPSKTPVPLRPTSQDRSRGRRPLNWRWVSASAFAVLLAAALSALGDLEPVAAGPSAQSRASSWRYRPRARSRARWTSPTHALFGSAIALSPDGQSLAFIGAPSDGARDASASTTAGGPAAAAGARLLYVRRLERSKATPVEGTAGAESPFFSPDGQWVGFWQAGPDVAGRLPLGDLRKVSISGGPVVTVCRTALPAGISWGANGRIIFANHGGGGLWQVADAGGTPEALTTPDSLEGRDRPSSPAHSAGRQSRALHDPAITRRVGRHTGGCAVAPHRRAESARGGRRRRAIRDEWPCRLRHAWARSWRSLSTCPA